MTIKIRTRIILSFVLIIVLPALVTFFSIALAFDKMEEKMLPSQENEASTQIEEINNQLRKTIIQSMPYVNDYNRFYSRLEPYIEKYQLHIRIIDNYGLLLFDSRDEAASMQKFIQESDSKGLNIHFKFTQYNLPVIIDGKQTATAKITVNPEVSPFNTISDTVQEIFKGILGGIGKGFLSLFLLIIFLTWYLSRTILNPLKNLSTATARIAQGDLDFEISSNRQDEIGIFVRAFNSMRLQLKDSLEKQRDYEKVRKEMIASISHDLRTPISSIKGYVEGLRDGMAEDEETYNRYLDVINDKTEQLNRQIEDLFQFSQLEIGRLEINLHLMNSRVLLESILHSYELRKNEKGPSIFVERPLAEVPVMADSRRLEQVITNLLENAIRYVSSEGKVVVRAFTQGDDLIVAVEDNGPGIAAEDIEHLFERFYRGEKSRSREFGGAGLGLAICKYIVESHHGRIWVKSEEGKGTIFMFSLPLSEQSLLSNNT